MKNVQEELEDRLDDVLDSADHSRDGVKTFHWFQLAAVAVRCLIMIASALWDKEA